MAEGCIDRDEYAWYPAEYRMIEPEMQQGEQVAPYPQVFRPSGTLGLS
jgi:hypothetical protein